MLIIVKWKGARKPNVELKLDGNCRVMVLEV